MYYFLDKLTNHKITHFDFGSVQTSWRWHSWRYNSLWQATHPRKNIKAGATYLKELMKTHTGDVWKAVGQYHSPSSPKRAHHYSQSVRQICCKKVNSICCNQ
ncbi:transglycosylase SLT domain-containing protein [uncultured Shewanella sp.]|uniref:transglycosylase SLT domain-containing protein n=1 Tax=uncultured Shewanella sp. TaxID=173975 RepID=UPI00345BCEB4